MALGGAGVAARVDRALQEEGLSIRLRFICGVPGDCAIRNVMYCQFLIGLVVLIVDAEIGICGASRMATSIEVICMTVVTVGVFSLASPVLIFG